MKKLGIYIHIPFCVKKCAYCDFNSTDRGGRIIQPYINALIGEIGAFCAQDYTVDTIFFGGGTPSILTEKQLNLILNTLYKKFKLSDPEITIEANPGTVGDFKPIAQAGINRLSLGLQSTHDRELKKLGRIHTYDVFIKSYENARKYIDNINVDLMFGLPDQTLDNWADTLNKINTLKPEHISCYGLKVEQGTPFAEMELNLPDERTDRQMYSMTDEILCGYTKYEISNYAADGFECKHNLKYWSRKPYAGFGAGAHSHLDNVRSFNICDIEEYIRADNKKEGEEVLSVNDAMSEFMFLGLRLSRGISAEDFHENFELDLNAVFGSQLEKNLKLGTLNYHNGRYVLSGYGIDVSNVVLSDFLLS